VESIPRINSIDDSELASEQPTELRPTVVAGGRELCSNCGAPLAADQRYCTECGQRRGAPRFPFMEGVAQRTREAAVPPRQPRPRLTTNASLIAGIATLLLAMGIGVLIGRTGDGSSSKGAPPVQVVSVAGGSTGAAGASSAGTAGTSSTTPAASAAAGAAKAKATHTSTKGTFTTKAPPPKVVTVGSPGKGAGYQGGKFTGNFFGQ
jgi:hypothetical protein